MGRALVVILLLAVFFLSGTLFGVNHEKQSSQPTALDESMVNDNLDWDLKGANSDRDGELDHEVKTVQTDADHERDDKKQKESSKPITQTAASFLGHIIHGFYDIILTLCYQFAKLFYQ